MRIRISDDEALVLWEWNRADPPDHVERWRNDRIEQLQGTRNPFIDEPSRADALIFSVEAKPKVPVAPAQPASKPYLVKGNINAKGARIYHVSGGRDYRRTKINKAKGERWFCSEEEARAAGWRPPLP